MTGEVRIAQVGCGHWGKNLARNYAELGALAAVCDGDAATAERIAATHGAPARSFVDILDDATIDGISLATPAVTHPEMALKAIAAGKHVFIEKPLALGLDDAERVIAAAAAADRVLMVGHLLQYHPIFIALGKMVSEGALGRLRYVYSNRLSLGKFRNEENVLWSFAPHDFSMILGLVGEEPDRITAEGAVVVTDSIADWCLCHLSFPSGVRAHVHASWLHPYKEHRLVVVGDAGMAVFEDSRPQWDERLAFYRHRIDRSGPIPAPLKAEAEYVPVEWGEPLREECSHFLACIRTGERPRTDGREGLRVLKVLNRAEAALEHSLGGEKP